MKVNAGKEIFKPIPSYEGLYEISNFCNVKSLPKRIQRGKDNAWMCLPERILRPTNGDITLVKDKRKKTFDTQTLFKIVFDGFKPDGKRKTVLLNINDKVLAVKRRQLCQIIKAKLKTKSCKSTGVSKINKVFTSHICIKQKDLYLGTFCTEKEAYIFYKTACDNEFLYNGNAKEFRIIIAQKTYEKSESQNQK